MTKAKTFREAERRKLHIALRMNLRFFDGEKTEKATPRKKTKAREEGQVAKSNEIATALMLILVFSVLGMAGGFMLDRLLSVFQYSLVTVANAGDYLNPLALSGLFGNMMLQTVIIVAPVFLSAMIVGVAANLAQVGWHPTTKPLKPKFSKLNPAKGVKRLFSMQVLVELAKSLLKFGIILYVIYNLLEDESRNLLKLLDMELLQAVSYLGGVVVQLGINVGVAYLFIAAADFAYVRWKHAKDLRMSKQEVKEEYKNIEGNPQIKGKIRQKMREASMRRMMQDVPKADVIITNPTHFAVALTYDKEKGEAPVVVAKGTDFLAQRIKDVAKEHNVTIVENKPLARALYATVDIGREIPQELYQTVAEVLAYVFKLKNPA